MNVALQSVLGLVLVVVGLVLALALPDTELGWFRGRPLGVVLVVVGVLDLAESWSRRRRA